MIWVQLAIWGVTLLAGYLARKIGKRDPVNTERFEKVRIEEGGVLPVVFGAAELSMNLRWIGPATKLVVSDKAGDRTEWYAPMAGALCHGELTSLEDVKFGDRWLSAAIPTKPTLGPANSQTLPYRFEGTPYETMINAIQWFGGTDAIDGQGGIAGRMHVHPGTIDQAPCPLLQSFWTPEFTSGFPKQSYVVFGGTGRCMDDFTDLCHNYKWRVTQNNTDGIFAGGGGAPTLGNPIPVDLDSPLGGIKYCTVAGVMFPENGSTGGCEVQGLGHYVQCGDGLGNSCFDAPTLPEDQGVKLVCVYGPFLPAPNTIVVRTGWAVCAGCTQGYINMARLITCARAGDQVRVRFKWLRSAHYAFRFPNCEAGDDTLAGGGGASVIMSRNWDHGDINDPDPYPGGGWSISHNFDNLSRWQAMGAVDAPEQVDVTFTIPNSHTAQGNICYLRLLWGGGWRQAWAEYTLWDFDITVTPAAGSADIVTYMADRYTTKGWFYWGTNASPPQPSFIVTRIPTAVSGAGIKSGANPIDCIYDVLTDSTYGMQMDPAGVNLANFQLAAQTCLQEGLQVSHVVSTQSSAEDIINDFLTAIDGILYTNRQTGLLEITLVRADYSVSLLPLLDRSNVLGEVSFEQPQPDELINELRLTYRRYRSRGIEGETVTQQLGEAPYSPYFGAMIYHLQRNPSDVVITQGATTISPSDYIVRPDGLLAFVPPASSVDTLNPDADPLIAHYTAGGSPPGFEDAVVTAFDLASAQSLGQVRSENISIQMLMDEVAAQKTVERALLGRTRALKSFSLVMDRSLPDLHPGSMVKLGDFKNVNFGGLPVRVLQVTDDETGVRIEGIEEKWGYLESALVFPPNPDRPPLGFPGDAQDGGGLGTAPRPLGIGQISPSNVRLALFPADPDFPMEIARTRNPLYSTETGFYVGQAGEDGGGQCPGGTPEYISVAAGTTYYDDASAPNDGCPVYYWLRHVRTGWNASPWIGPLLATLEDATPPATAQDPVAPLVDPEEIEDFVTQEGHVVLWISDPQSRVLGVRFRTRLDGENWGAEQTPATGYDVDNSSSHPHSAGWWFADVAIMMVRGRWLDVQWQVEYAWATGSQIITETVRFPLHREPVWDATGALITAGDPPEIVTASRQNVANPTEILFTNEGEGLTTDGGEALTL